MLRPSWDVCTLVTNDSEFIVCLSVCQLAYFLTDITEILGYPLFWMIYLSEIFWGHPWDILTLFPNKCKLFVYLSVCQVAHFPVDIKQMQGYLLFSKRYLPETCLRHFWDILIIFPNKCKLFGCLSVCQLAYFARDIKQMQGYLLF